MRSASRWSWFTGLCGLGLAACAGEIAGSPDLLAEVKRYYDRHALEEDGLCRSPQLGPVTGSSIQEQSADRLIVRVGYAYSDPNPKLLSGQCRGFGTRNFTIARRADELEVLQMTGPQRRGIKINKIDDSNVW